MSNSKYNYRVLNANTSTLWLNKNIIAGFPGTGKSTAAKLYPNCCIDMESSDYHWITDEDGNKICHPDWPMNYVNAITMVAANTNTPQSDVLISTHNEVLAELDRRKIYYTAVIPKTKEIYMRRYYERGNTSDFIQKLDENFDTFVQSVLNTHVFAVYETDGYMTDILINTPSYEDLVGTGLKYKCDIDNRHFAFEVNSKRFPKGMTSKSILILYDFKMLSLDYTLTNFKDILYVDFDAWMTEHTNATINEFIDYLIEITSDEELDKPYVAAVMQDGLLESFCNKDILFTLVVPKTYDENIGNCKNDEEFKQEIEKLTENTFQTLYTDIHLDFLFAKFPSIFNTSYSSILYLLHKEMLNAKSLVIELAKELYRLRSPNEYNSYMSYIMNKIASIKNDPDLENNRSS